MLGLIDQKHLKTPLSPLKERWHERRVGRAGRGGVGREGTPVPGGASRSWLAQAALWRAGTGQGLGELEGQAGVGKGW